MSSVSEILEKDRHILESGRDVPEHVLVLSCEFDERILFPSNYTIPDDNIILSLNTFVSG